MDVFEYRASKTVNTDGVCETYNITEGDLGGLFVRLKNVIISETHTQWDIAFLETYIKLNMVPRSLRWEVCPQKGEVELESWFRYFNEAGVNFLCFLVGKKQSKLTKLDEEVKALKESLIPFKDLEEYKDRTNNLLKILDKKEKEQKNKKIKKYNKDYGDYSVFAWQKKLAEEEPSKQDSTMEAITQDDNVP